MSDKDAFLLDLAQKGVGRPEQPEALSLLRQTRRFGHLYFEGGLANQPYITMLELNTVIEAEIEDMARKIANERLRAAYAKKKKQEERAEG